MVFENEQEGQYTWSVFSKNLKSNRIQDQESTVVADVSCRVLWSLQELHEMETYQIILHKKEIGSATIPIYYTHSKHLST